MRRVFLVLAGAVVVAVLPLSAVSADSTVVVRGIGFAAGSSTSLAIMGCDAMYDSPGAAVATYLSPSPGGPAGTRALKYDLDGGTAVGSQHRVASMTGTTVAGASVLAADGTSGVAYAAIQSPEDDGTTLAWIGRASFAVDAGAWRQVNAADLTYTWTRYDFATQRPVGEDGGSATVPAFVARHGGDGPGFYAVGFGCDGHAFKVDALRTGSPGDVTTYDLEGYTTATGISGSAARVTAGEPVTLHGTLSSDMIGPLAQGVLALEAQPFGESGFTPVAGAALDVSDGQVTTTLTPTTHTVYRWRFGGSSSADGSVSPLFAVDVAARVTAAPDPSAAADAPAIVGETAPSHGGLRATLWRLGPKGPVAVGSDLTAADGSYRIPAPADQQGRWRYFVSVPAGDGTLAGQSPTQVFAPKQQ